MLFLNSPLIQNITSELTLGLNMIILMMWVGISTTVTPQKKIIIKTMILWLGFTDTDFKTHWYILNFIFTYYFAGKKVPKVAWTDEKPKVKK